jgi:hypothetical protein
MISACSPINVHPASARLPSPAITMAHGYAGVREHGIAKFAEAFADGWLCRVAP